MQHHTHKQVRKKVEVIELEHKLIRGGELGLASRNILDDDRISIRRFCRPRFLRPPFEGPRSDETLVFLESPKSGPLKTVYAKDAGLAVWHALARRGIIFGKDATEFFGDGANPGKIAGWWHYGVQSATVELVSVTGKKYSIAVEGGEPIGSRKISIYAIYPRDKQPKLLFSLIPADDDGGEGIEVVAGSPVPPAVLESKKQDTEVNSFLSLCPISHDRSIKLFESGSIEYGDGDKLVYEANHDPNEGGLFSFYFYRNGEVIKLNDMLDNSDWRFTPTKDTFSCVLDEKDAPLYYPEIRFGIDLLKKGKIEILSGLHEIGHAKIYETILAILKSDPQALFQKVYRHWPELRKFREYISFPGNSERLNEFIKPMTCWEPSLLSQVTEVNYLLRTLLRDNNEKFQERYAWAYAINTARKLHLLDEFTNEDLREHYCGLLRTYGNDFLESLFPRK